MERTLAKAAIEAILFAMGDAVEISRLADAIEEDVRTTRSILEEMGRDISRRAGESALPSLIMRCSCVPRRSCMNT